MESWGPYFQVNPTTHISPFQTLVAYLGGSAFQTIVDNPITSYRQLVQQYAKGLDGRMVDPKVAAKEARKVFRLNPVGASLSGLGPRLAGVGVKRVPKFTSFLGYAYLFGEDQQPGLMAATVASILSAPFINPVRMIEKQQRAYLRETGKSKSVLTILQEAKGKNFKPLFRGTLPLMGHSLASATTGLVGQPILQAKIQDYLSLHSHLGGFATSLLASACVTPIYVALTNPLARLEVIMQTSAISKGSISLRKACKVLLDDSRAFGLRGIFRGQGVGIVKAIVSLTMFHEGRRFFTQGFQSFNSDE